MSISPVLDIVADLRAGRMVILVDEEDRENEGDLVIAAEHCTPEAINFMAKFGRGLICLTLTEARCRQLELPLMVRDNKAQHGTAFTMSIEAAEGVTTGISAQDRSRTVQAAVAKNATPADIVQPGHIFPLMAQNGGVLVRAGHTEAGCDFAQLAGCTPASVICEILKEDGTMARLPDLLEFAREHGLKIGTIRDLIQHRSETEKLIECVADKQVECAQGKFRLRAFADRSSGDVHLAMSRGEITAADETLVRVHEAVCVLDFIDHGSRGHTYSVDFALRKIAEQGCGVLVMLHRAETGNALLAALKSERNEKPAYTWDPRIYGIGAQILREIGVGRMRLMSSPRKMPSMAGFGLEITGYFTPSGEKTA
ncbi:MAG: 3,4-dihydroxy-2-butanone-4-phosphate synthase [Sterolibacteriaceae bacterium]|nr:3,4-dihydroxy-2-butanone-4-phosphate synthase [Sterolibacteriaceae bacterium]